MRYALPAIAPYKKEHEREQQTATAAGSFINCAHVPHAAHHRATMNRCQPSKIQLLVLLKTRPGRLEPALFPAGLLTTLSGFGEAGAT
jgi:hypothetical protein